MTSDALTTRRAYLTAVATGTAALGGCSSDGGGGDGGDGGGNTTTTTTGTTSSEQDLREISFATTETGSIGVLTSIVQEEGFDEQRGIKINVQATTPAKGPQLLKNKAVETSLFSPQGAAIANTEGSNIRLFGPLLANHNSLITTADNTDVQSWEDLKNEKVGILSPPSGIWNHTNLLLNEMGYSTDDFDFRKGSPGSIHSFNARGDVAAHVHFVPVTVKSIASGGMRELLFYPDKFQDQFGHNLQFTPLAAHQSWLDENPDAARSLREALIDAQKLFTDSPKDTISKYRDTIGLENQNQVDTAAERMPATYPAAWGSTQTSNLQSQLQMSKEYGLISDDAPTDIAVSDI
ncbi:ABC-type nitrate/sulfonate/bicarbonate transport system, substrate-binding protein [Halopenitus malekzadehii]|uniref:ABC-type nitrate/sulfonate/bicarbonate transport system, substrate-binding protein n=1 Tax=Halopenitus malekzadehii TaxID=1267564 RepID=A0A1H6JY51_9EURY|nr:ABC transporter substrate-binding protein [Halopenitus malekzadehii]SEH65552.1 ABC-type nitrate/sulfonate/bicarbonate transport system, substrate-binding protein [Halopenitus malekzadehii]